MRFRARYFLLSLLLCLLHQAAQAGVIARKNYFVPQQQWPSAIPRSATSVYLHYVGNYGSIPQDARNTDTIWHLQSFLDSIGKGGKNISFTVAFAHKAVLDSAWRLDASLRLIERCHTIRSGGLLRIRVEAKAGKPARTLSFNYLAWRKKTAETERPGYNHGAPTSIDPQMLQRYPIPIEYFDAAFTVGDLWILSIGIDDYADVLYRSCKSDARHLAEYFRRTQESTTLDSGATSVHTFFLADSMATKARILTALETIAGRAEESDIFIFNFSGESNYLELDSLPKRNYFFPWNVAGLPPNPRLRNPKEGQMLSSAMFSLEELLQRSLLIPAQRQLFITEAGPSGEFKIELLRRLVASSRESAGILNKSRVLLLPNEMGDDITRCSDSTIKAGPIAYAVGRLNLTSVSDFFEESQQSGIEFQLKQTLLGCDADYANYMDVFFEKRFFKQYRTLFSNDETEATRGIQPKAETLRRESGLIGKQYALLVGTNHYKGAGWDSLANPIYDVSEIGEVLRDDYGFEVTLLKDPGSAQVYQSLLNLYKTLQPNDQLLIYFAGHGDMDTYFSGDGFIVCSDSKAVSEDAARTTYLPYARLKRMINKIASRQTLVMLDVCHAGTFDDNILASKRDNREYGITNAKVLDLVRENAQRQTRKVLTSVGLGFALDGRKGQHSPFANLVLQTLRARGRNSEGIVRLDNLLQVLRAANLQQSEGSTVRKMEPYAAGFGSDESISEYILIPIERTDK
ncbi:MAG: caspase family protein [Chitinophagaceae bacterium]|nr:MAG: caspase family protein [Chitinophagaceae bacterium]